jgi:hypothetical protein
MEFIFHCLDRGDKGAITYNEFVESLHGPLVARKGATALEMMVCLRPDPTSNTPSGPNLHTLLHPDTYAYIQTYRDALVDGEMEGEGDLQD